MAYIKTILITAVYIQLVFLHKGSSEGTTSGSSNIALSNVNISTTTEVVEAVTKSSQQVTDSNTKGNDTAGIDQDPTGEKNETTSRDNRTSPKKDNVDVNNNTKGEHGTKGDPSEGDTDPNEPSKITNSTPNLYNGTTPTNVEDNDNDTTTATPVMDLYTNGTSLAITNGTSTEKYSLENTTTPLQTTHSYLSSSTEQSMDLPTSPLSSPGSSPESSPSTFSAPSYSTASTHLPTPSSTALPTSSSTALPTPSSTPSFSTASPKNPPEDSGDDSSKPGSEPNSETGEARRLALGIIVPVILVAVVIGSLLCYRKYKKKGRGYITLDDFGTYEGMQNPNYDGEL